MTHKARISVRIASCIQTYQCGISVQFTDVKICPCFERTGHHGQYEEYMFFFIPLVKFVVTSARMLNECATNSLDECWKCLLFNQHITLWIQ